MVVKTRTYRTNAYARSANGHGASPNGCAPSSNGHTPPLREVAVPQERLVAPLPGSVEEPEDMFLRRIAQPAHDDAEGVLALVSHELRTPLTVILGQAHLLQRRLEERADTPIRDRQAAATLVEQARRLNALINTLLDVSQSQHGQFSIVALPLDCGALLRRIVQERQPTLSSHTLQLQADSAPLWVLGDTLRLEQVFQNLLQNAVKYSLPGRTITVRLDSCNDQVRITVIDQGIGIAAGALPTLFQRFTRVRQTNGHAVSGLGMGLYLCRVIVDLHGGRIEVESTEGVGSSFTLLLPQLVRT